jgi:proline iminopeptidase
MICCIAVSMLVASPSSVCQTSTKSASAPVPENGTFSSEGYFNGADGVRLFYRRFGHGKEVIVFLHGGPGGTMNNGFEMLALAKRRTVILYDQRGGGRSELISDPKLLTAQHHVRDLEALREYFHLERMSLLGISWGSGVATLYAAEHPARVERLLLVSPMPIARIPFGQERAAKLNAIQGKEAVERNQEISRLMVSATDQEVLALCRESFSITFRPYLANQANLKHVIDRCADIPPAAMRNRQIVSRATLASLGDWDFRPLLVKLKIPALVFEGTKTNVPLSSTREWAATIPNARRLLLIPDAGHEFWAEQPAAFVKAAEEFLKGNYPRQAVEVTGTVKKNVDAERLTLRACTDTNLNFFLPTPEARALVPSIMGSPFVTPLFGGNTTPLNVAHFHCKESSFGGSSGGPLHFALARVPLNPTGFYVMWVLTDNRSFRDALRSRGIDTHLATNVSFQIAGATWTTKWDGKFSPYSVTVHQTVPAAISNGQIDWAFSATHGVIRITGAYTLTEEFLDRSPLVHVPQQSALRRFFDQSRGNTALTHRNSFDLTLPPQCPTNKYLQGNRAIRN